MYSCKLLSPGKFVVGQAPCNATFRAIKDLRRELGLKLKRLAVWLCSAACVYGFFLEIMLMAEMQVKMHVEEHDTGHGKEMYKQVDSCYALGDCCANMELPLPALAQVGAIPCCLSMSNATRTSVFFSVLGFSHSICLLWSMAKTHFQPPCWVG